MQVAEKKHPIRVIVCGKYHENYAVPADKLKGFRILLNDYRDEDDETVSVAEALKETFPETDSSVVHLRGFRLRDNLTQTQLAKKIGTTQSAIASMESGRRAIGKVIAKKLAKVFDTTYKAFL